MHKTRLFYFVTGLPGIGKTTQICMVARERGGAVIYVNGAAKESFSDIRKDVNKRYSRLRLSIIAWLLGRDQSGLEVLDALSRWVKLLRGMHLIFIVDHVDKLKPIYFVSGCSRDLHAISLLGKYRREVEKTAAGIQEAEKTAAGIQEAENNIANASAKELQSAEKVLALKTAHQKLIQLNERIAKIEEVMCNQTYEAYGPSIGQHTD